MVGATVNIVVGMLVLLKMVKLFGTVTSEFVRPEGKYFLIFQLVQITVHAKDQGNHYGISMILA